MKRFLFIAGIMLFATSNTFAENLEASVTDADEGTENGEIDLTISGGAAPFILSWSGPDGFSSEEEDLFDLAPGTYTVTVTDAWCGVATLDVVVEEKIDDPGVGIQEVDAFDLTIYPNPTNGMVYFTSEFQMDVIVYNALGEALFNKKAVQSIDLSNEPAGVYMLKVTSTEGTVIRKVTLQ